MKNVEHIGIAVSNLSAAESLYSALLNTAPYKREAVESEQVTTSFFKVNQTKIELLEASGPDSAIARFIERPDLRSAAGQAGHARVQGYDWDKVNAVMIAAYEELLQRVRGKT